VALLLVTVSGCASGASPASSDAVTGSSPLPAALTFTVDGEPSAGMVTFADGGTVATTAPDGTTFELVVPPMALAADTEIRMTPLSDVEGIGAGAAHAVQLEPEGLEFFQMVRLTITPATPIPVAEQLMFEANGEGADAGLALIDPNSKAIVLLLEHFSIGGVASATSQQRAAFLLKSAENAERRIVNEVRSRISAERMRQLLGEFETEVDLSESLAEYQREVVEKRREAAALSCKALMTYMRTMISFERQLQLLGTSEADEVSSQERLVAAFEAMSARYEACEKEAIAECRETEDPSVLVRFWLANERPADQARAEKVCLEQDFQIDKTVTKTEMNVTFSIRYTGTKCGGPEGDWVIDSEGTLSAYGGTAEIGGPVVVEISEGAVSGPVEGTANFRDENQGETQGRFSGIATFVEDPSTLELEITSGAGSGYSYGFLDTGLLTLPGHLTLPLEAGDFCS